MDGEASRILVLLVSLVVQFFLAGRVRLLVGDQVTLKGELHATLAEERLSTQLLVIPQVHLDVEALATLAARVRLLTFRVLATEMPPQLV